jgi:hypothetical protein
MILFAAGSQAPASRVHVISHAIESSWKMTRSWSFVVNLLAAALRNEFSESLQHQRLPIIIFVSSRQGG